MGREFQRSRGGNAGGGGGQTNNGTQEPTEGGADAIEENEADIPVPSYTALRWTEELLRVINPELQAFTAADRKLMGAFGDTIHQNAST